MAGSDQNGRYRFEMGSVVPLLVNRVPAYRYNGEQMADELRVVLQGLRSVTRPVNRFAATFIPPTLVERVLGRTAARA